MGLCCSLPCVRQRNGNLSSQISTCGKAGSLNSRYMNNGRFIKARQMASGRTFRLGLQIADFILVQAKTWAADGRFHIAPYKEFISGQAEPCFYQGLVLSRPASFNGHSVNNVVAKWPDLWISSTDGKFYHFPCKEFINGRAIRKLEFREEIKGNLVDPASSHMLVSKTKYCRRGQISTFGLCVADFILSRIRNLSAARPSNFIKGSQSELQLYQRDGRFIKKMPNWPDLQIYATGCESHMIPCEQVVSGRASQFSTNAWLVRANGRFIKR